MRGFCAGVVCSLAVVVFGAAAAVTADAAVYRYCELSADSTVFEAFIAPPLWCALTPPVVWSLYPRDGYSVVEGAAPES